MSTFSAGTGLDPAASLSIAEDLQATGHAKVIVVLRQNVAAAAASTGEGRRGRPRDIGAGTSSAIASIARHFVPVASSVEMLGASSGGGRRGRGGAAAASTYRQYDNLGVVLGTVTRDGLEALKHESAAATVVGAPQFSLIRPTSATAAKVETGVTWGLARMGVPRLWDAGLTGAGVLVGHLDTGVDGKHKALAKAIKSYAEFDDDGVQVAGAPPTDSATHGSHTAGSILARRVGKTAFGVAPGSLLASAKVIEGGDVIARILGGLDWAVGQGVRVLSLSLGLRGFRDDFMPVIDILRDRGILPVFAIGNEGPNTSRSPGNYPQVLSIGASDRQDRVADFSSSQKFARPERPITPDFVAPGVDIISCVPGGYMKMDGTSMATPHVSGVAALLFEAKPEATVAEVEAALFAGCTRPKGMLEERGGRGVLDAAMAFERLTGASLGTSAPTAPKKVVKKTAKKKKSTKKAPAKKTPVPKKAAKKKIAAGARRGR